MRSRCGRWTVATCWLLACILWLTSCDARAGAVRIATTTSTFDSGLIDVLLPPFERESGISVVVLVAGTGQALELGRAGDVDILLVHARDRELAFVEEGYGVDRREVMWNDFVIVGPPADPAAIRGTTDAVDALRKIANAEAPFVSRGDDSGTHLREQGLWQRSGEIPTSQDAWYLSAGQGMSRCLTMAHEKSAYTLVDRGTWLALSAQLDLSILVEGGTLLRNPYGALLVNPARHPTVRAEAARRLLDYLTSSKARDIIDGFRVQGQRLFHPVEMGR